ncbi:hypothetical protein K435DRAFT_828939 [Dendrothele bispora CBS 962.96]|uniref:DUF654-domain-containing protein n=1 Tax=Dendrothele bispora (strain CBS 962.96) TaxID=1314807 RepID=A0A4S8M289_DENBC|nr:hypothetical protein K435DRAFT_828939 [Dendrothele bispora CBS 962.96]
MPPRLSKRQQRELEELEALAGPSTPNEGKASGNEEDGSGDEAIMKRHAAGFAALFAQEDGADEENEEEEEEEQTKAKSKSGKSKKSKKKKKATAPMTNETGPSLTNPQASEAPVSTSIRDTAKETPATPVPVSIPKSDKKAAKKAKARAKKAGKDADGLDEIDRALEELSVKHPEFQKIASTVASSSSSAGFASHNASPLSRLPALLSITPSNLDNEAEMRKFFGSKVVDATKNASGSGGGGASTSAGRRAQARLQPNQRSNLVRPQNTWPPAQMRDGLSCRPLVDEELVEQTRNTKADQDSDVFGVPGEKWWTVEYSKRYKSMTLSFMQTVLSGDPNGFYVLLRQAPWHADTLLQLAEVFRHREEHAQAIDFISRAIFSYERAFIGSSSAVSSSSFSPLTGLHRLSFSYIPNRPFFLAIHRQVSDYARRGLSRTAFEWAKLLLSLDWAGDPHGACFWIETLVAKLAGRSDKKSKEKEDGGDWLQEAWDMFEERRVRLEKDGKGQSKGKERDLRMDPSVLPGWTWSRALVMRMSGTKKEAATSALVEAIRSFPSIVPLLADKLEVEIPGTVRAHKDFKVEVDGGFLSTADSILHLLSHLYVQRAHSLWKDASISSWFSHTLTENFTSLPSSLPISPRRERFLHIFSNSTNLQYSVYRHIIVSESSTSSTTSRRLFSFIPKHVINESGAGLACDPLPPPPDICKSRYDSDFFAGVEALDHTSTPGRPRTRRQREMEARMLARMIPDANFRHQLEAVFEGNPAMNQRFPGGIVEFVRHLMEMDPEQMEAILMATAAGAMAAGEPPRELQDNREMPGGFDLVFRDMDDEDGEGEPVVWRPAQEIEGALAEAEHVHEEEEEDEWEEEVDEEQDIAPMPVRVLRNIFGRFWGGGTGAVSVDDSDSDEAENDGDLPPRDTAGVD